MARLFDDGAEAGDVLAWDAGGATVTTSNARIGGRCYQFDGNSALHKVITAGSEFFVRFAWKMNADLSQNLIRWSKSGVTLGLLSYSTVSKCIDIFTSTGTLQVAGTKIVLANTWYVIELHVKINDSTGVIEMKIDGVLQPGFSGDTKPGADSTIDTFSWFSNVSGTSQRFSLDDVAINNTAGGVDDSWCGDAHYYVLLPNGNGDNSDFTGSDGNSTDNYLLVDEIPLNSDTDYVESATSGHKDLYQFGNLSGIPLGAAVKRVIVETRARELSADGDSIELVVKVNGVEGASSPIVLGTSYAAQKASFPVNPDTGVAWLQSEIDGMQAGFEVP